MKVITNSYPALITVILIAFSCDRISNKDLSLTPDEYQDMGMPDHSKIWDYKDYNEACATLSNIKSLKSFSLPRKGSKKSGEIFDRMISTDNLSFLLDESVPLYEKAHQIQKYVDIQGCFVTAYTSLNNREQYYNHELIDLYLFGLTIAQDMLDLGHLINESIEEKDIEMQSRFHSIQNLYLTMVLFVLKNQQNSYFFEEKDLIRLSEFLYYSVLINREWMEDAAVKNIEQQVKMVIENTSSDDIKKKYTMLLDEL